MWPVHVKSSHQTGMFRVIFIPVIHEPVANYVMCAKCILLGIQSWTADRYT